jgi:hypothetical protein
MRRGFFTCPPGGLTFVPCSVEHHLFGYYSVDVANGANEVVVHHVLGSRFNVQWTAALYVFPVFIQYPFMTLKGFSAESVVGFILWAG